MGLATDPTAMQQQLLRHTGALHSSPEPGFGDVAPEVVRLVPESVARDHVIFPLRLDGETLTLASTRPHDLALADKLTFILNKKIKLVPATGAAILAAITFYYRQADGHGMFGAPAVAVGDHEAQSWAAPLRKAKNAIGSLGKSVVEFKKGMKGLDDDAGFAALDDGPPPAALPSGVNGMFFFTVTEGQRVLMRRLNGSLEILVGPRRVWRGWSTFTSMQQYVAHPGEFLLIRFRDGRQESMPGPAEVWFDPRVHQSIQREEALQLAAKEAVVVYARREGTVARRIEYGPAQFIPQPGEWLHTFTWHASKGGHLGVEKVPHGLVFQKLWLMPDQMYHDVVDVRTADDAVLTVRLMIFFELVNIERMLDTTHDPIGDFVNAATSDVVAFTGRHDFENFKRNVPQLNELETYRQLASRAEQSGYRINKVVYRGYGAPKPLQDMHDKAIEARTKLQLDRATEQQAQDLEDYKLLAQITRSGKRRVEQSTEQEHDLEMARRRGEADLAQKQAQRAMQRDQQRMEAELNQAIRQGQDALELQHLTALRNLGVDLTAFLTQARADRVIELRGPTAGTHVHLDRLIREESNNGAE